MDWRETFLRRFGPGVLCGITLRHWTKLLWRERHEIDAPYLPRICAITFQLLLGLFPNARFVHIHRNPYRVFQSSRALFLTMFAWHGLQRPNLEDLDERILRQYREMYNAFFHQRSFIPAGRYHEMAFEQLEKDPIGEVRKLYEALQLPDFASFEPELRRYVGSLAGYRKNVFVDLPPEHAARIGEQWKRCFDEWGYPTLDLS